MGATALNVGAAFSLSTTGSTASGAVPLVAEMRSGYTPPEPAAGVPENETVRASKLTPAGSLPDGHADNRSWKTSWER